MKNVFKFLGIIAFAAVIAFSMAACGDDDNGEGGGGNSGGGAGSGGTFTLTGIPSEYNGMYAGTPGNFLSEGVLQGFQSYNTKTNNHTYPRVSNGSVSIPMWLLVGENYKRYTGNDTLGFTSFIVDFYSSSNGDNCVGNIYFNSVTFSNGNAARSWNDAFWHGSN